MSENVEVARDLPERWNAGVRSVPRAYFDPVVELETPFSSVAGEPHRGCGGIERWVRDIGDQFAERQIHVDDIDEVDNATLTVARIHGRGRGSDIEFDQPCAVVTDFGSDHRITRMRIYLDRADALKAVGLAE